MGEEDELGTLIEDFGFLFENNESSIKIPTGADGIKLSGESSVAVYLRAVFPSEFEDSSLYYIIPTPAVKPLHFQF